MTWAISFWSLVISVKHTCKMPSSTMFSICTFTFVLFVFPNSLCFNLFPNLPEKVPTLQNTKCRQDTETYEKHLANLSMWAEEILDATGNSPAGQLYGNVHSLGNLEECLNSKAPFRTKYCVVKIKAMNLPVPNPPRDPKSLEYSGVESVFRRLVKHNDRTQLRRDEIHIGWCIPSSCTSRELESSVNSYLKNSSHLFARNNVSFQANIETDLCQIKEEEESIGASTFSFCVLSTGLVILVLTATFMEYKGVITDKATKGPFIRIFSPINNLKSLMEAKYDKKLVSLNGMKMVCFLFVMLGHCMLLSISLPIENFNLIEEYNRSWRIILENGPSFVDGFFIFSGFLLTYKLLSHPSKPFLNISLRYIYLTPSYAYVIFFYIAILQYIGEGPLWNRFVSAEVQKCKDNWWLNLIYLSNYINTDQMCMLQSWYLADDFHFMILGLVILYVFTKNETAAKITLLFCLLASFLITFTTAYVYGYQIIFLTAIEDMQTLGTSPNFTEAYIHSHNRATPYLVGMVGGYIFHRMKKEDKQFSRMTGNIIFYTSLTICFASLFSVAILLNANYVYRPFWESLYIALHRLMWSSGTVGLIFYINFGQGYFVHKILCWKPWIPLGKLIYGAYLSHMILTLRFLGSSRTIYYNATNMFALVLGLLALSFTISLALYICIEAPIRNAVQFYFFTKKIQESKKNCQNETPDSK